MPTQHNLQSGMILGNYEIIRVLGEGSFGITYLARDTNLGMHVVIKEYFPSDFALRAEGSTIAPRGTFAQEYTKGKKRFQEEAQILARFNHPSIVRILNYFEACRRRPKMDTAPKLMRTLRRSPSGHPAGADVDTGLL